MSAALEPGQVFARDFRVERRLSQGGMGAVYVARQLSTDKLRALKLMHPQLVPDAKSRERFVAEARVGARIESEHVVEVLAAGVDDATGVPWLAMELLDGEDLGALSARRGALPAGEVRDAFAQLGHALGAAHAQGIVHRDLKPENLFLARSRRQGQAWVLKVLDFGIATALPSGAGAKVTTAVGSPLWMAPEQARPGDVILPSTDVWALGLIAFQLLTGRSYWRVASDETASIGAVLTEILMDPLVPASARAAELGLPVLPAGFDAWFARCVTRTADERFGDAGLAVAALDAVLAQVSERSPLEAKLATGLEDTQQRPAVKAHEATKASAPKRQVTGDVGLDDTLQRLQAPQSQQQSSSQPQSSQPQLSSQSLQQWPQQQSSAQQSSAQQSSAQHQSAQQSSAQQSSAQQSSAQHQSAQQSSAQQSSAQQSSAQQSSAQQPSAQQPSAQQPSAQQPSAQQPSAQQPSAQQSSAQQSSAQQSSAQQSSAQQSSAQQSSAQQSSAQQSSAQQSSAQQSQAARGRSILPIAAGLVLALAVAAWLSRSSADQGAQGGNGSVASAAAVDSGAPAASAVDAGVAVVVAPTAVPDAAVATVALADVADAAVTVAIAGVADAAVPELRKPAPRRPVAPVQPKSGVLSLLTSAPCDVTIDGAAVGQSPLNVPLPPGAHKVVLKNKAKGFTTELQALIASGEATTMTVEVPEPLPDTWVVEGIIEKVPYRFETLTREELKEKCLSWMQRFKKKNPVHKMTANFFEMPLETAGIDAKWTCRFVVEHASLEKHRR